ncbi:MAG: nucleotidyltransferase domain-containing protein [Candidatus Aenigmarchaeota archaeon]|nr:nucleotidyltransferase domain-containing protein [Candidatus Aenigmarchaeota archaeon]
MNKILNEHEQRKAYALSFAAYLMKELANKKLMDEINRIILFGSVAKSESTKESDVDIFIKTDKKSDKMVKIIQTMASEFYDSREALLFKTQAIDNKLNIIVGKLSDWKDIHRSIMSTGIVLWGRYEEKEKPSDTEHEIIFYWDSIGINRGSFLNALYGFTANNKRYPGMLEKFGGKRMGKSCIIIPVQHREDVIALFKKYKVSAKAIEVFVG